MVQPVPLRPGEDHSQRSERQPDIGMVEEAPAVEDGECDRCGDLVHACHDHGRNEDENKNEEKLEHAAAQRRRGIDAVVAVMDAVRRPQRRRHVLPAMEPVLEEIPHHPVSDDRCDEPRDTAAAPSRHDQTDQAIAPNQRCEPGDKDGAEEGEGRNDHADDDVDDAASDVAFARRRPSDLGNGKQRDQPRRQQDAVEVMIDQAPVLQDHIHHGRACEYRSRAMLPRAWRTRAGLAIFHRYHSRRWPSPRVGRCSLSM
jgi:hypothetical protein